MSHHYLRIGISGGTFDPIHHGHLIMMEEARQKLALDQVLFIPSGNPPHKKDQRVTSAEQRFSMVEAAIKTNPFFEASRIEIDRAGKTYTIDTLKQLKANYGAGVQLFFITGADVIAELTTWRAYEAVFTLCDFIAVLRPGYEKNEFDQHIQDLMNQYGARIHAIEAPQIDISSTAIRQRVTLGQSIKYLVPEGVEKFIYAHGLYK